MHVSLLLLTVALASDGEKTPVEVLARDGLGTARHFSISGRVLRIDRRAVLREKLTARLAQPGRLLDAIDTDEAENVHVTITVDGTSYSSTTDDDGTFDLEVSGLKSPLPVGTVPFTITMRSAGFELVRGGEGILHVFPDRGVLVVSDIDDTIVQTHVTDPSRLVKEVLTREGAELKPVAGAGTCWSAAKQAGAVGFVYLSGSPQNFRARIRTFLDVQGMPAGPILLKNVGSDDMLVQHAYKTQRLTWLLQMFPGLAFVLVGDDGERDPEIYSELKRRFPGRRISVVIRNTTGAPVDSPRFAGLSVVPDYAADPKVLAREVSSLKP